MKPIRSFAASLLMAAIAVIAISAPARPQDVDNQDIRRFAPPRPIPPRPFPGGVVTVKDVAVNASIRNGVAETEMTHVFRNDSGVDQEADFLFPIPAGASVSSFAMYDGEKRLDAKLLDKDDATRTYEEIVRRRKDPALLTYAARGALRARVYPIPARGERKVTLKLVTVLPREGDAKKYAWTLVGPYLPGGSGQRPGHVSVRVVIDSAQAIGNVYSPSHDVAIRRDSDTKVVVTWDSSGGKGATLAENPDLSLYISPARDAAKNVALSVLTYNASLPQVASLGGGMRQSGYFLVVASPTVVDAAKVALPKRVVMVLDRSGSMQDNNKIEQARGALRFALAKLRPQDSFNILTFSDRVDKFSPALVSASPDNVKRATAFVDDIAADGGTNIGQALKDGLAQFPERSRAGNTLMFFTDGLPTVGVTDHGAIVRDAVDVNRDKLARVFVFGVGYDVDVPFLDTVARSLRGDADYVRPDESIEVKTSRFVAKMSAPVLENLKLKIDGGNAGEIYPKPDELPDLFDGSQLVLVGRYTDGNRPVHIALTGEANGRPQTFALDTRFPAVDTSSAFLPRLWATRKIGYLMDEVRLQESGPAKQETIQQIVALSREFGVLTPYTALFVPEPGDRALDRLSVLDGRVPASGGQAPVFGGFGGGGMAGGIPAPTRATSGAAAVDLSQAARGQRSQNQTGNYYALSAKSSPAQQHDAELAQRIQNVAQRTFYQVGPVWTDAGYDPKKQQQIVKVKLYSPAYFALTRRSADFAKWAALGDQVLIAANARQAVQFGDTGRETLTEKEIAALTGG